LTANTKHINKHDKDKANNFPFEVRSTKNIPKPYEEVTMKLINSTQVFLALAMTRLFLAGLATAIMNEDHIGEALSTLKTAIIAPIPVIRVGVPMTCTNPDYAPTYTDPKGGQIECDNSEGTVTHAPIRLLVALLVGGAIFGALRVMP
jgi:hypothetical protein